MYTFVYFFISFQSFIPKNLTLKILFINLRVY